MSWLPLTSVALRLRWPDSFLLAFPACGLVRRRSECLVAILCSQALVFFGAPGGGYSQRAQLSLRATSMALLRSQPLLARNTSLRELEHCQAVKTTSELELFALELSAAGVGGASVGEIVVKLGRFKPVEGSGLEDSGVGVAVPSGLLVGSGAVLGSGVLL